MIYLHSGVHIICLNGSLVKLSPNKSCIYGSLVCRAAVLYATKENILTNLNIIQDPLPQKGSEPYTE
jgi:hypothetical protein